MAKKRTAKVARTTAGLRNVLFDEIEDLRRGDSNPSKARAVALLANTVLGTVTAETEFHKYVASLSDGSGKTKRLRKIELGTPALELKG